MVYPASKSALARSAAAGYDARRECRSAVSWEREGFCHASVGCRRGGGCGGRRASSGWWCSAAAWPNRRRPSPRATASPPTGSGPRPSPSTPSGRWATSSDVCKIGPRISGTDGMKKQQDLLKKHFEDLGAKVAFQRFTARQLSEGQRRGHGQHDRLLAPRARRGASSSARTTTPGPSPTRSRTAAAGTTPFVSANDGGSGVALLMEMANHMKDLDTQRRRRFRLLRRRGVRLRRRTTSISSAPSSSPGSTRRTRTRPSYVAAVLLDMVGGKNAAFPVEQNSFWKAPDLVARPVEHGRRPWLHGLPLQRVQPLRRAGRPHRR